MVKSLLQNIELIPLEIFAWNESANNKDYIFLVDNNRAEISEIGNKGKIIREFRMEHNYVLHERAVGRYVLPSELGRLACYLRFKLQQIKREA